MSLYRDHVLPRLVDLTCGTRGMDGWRAKVTEGLRGRVVEIGFGSGLNVAHYPVGVDVVLAVEPAPIAIRLAAKRVAGSMVAVEHIGDDARFLPLEDQSCDSALSTFTLCTVPDPDRVLDEIFRVLRPGGRLHVLEHGISPDPRVAAWQRRLDPVQRRLADGCHLTRDATTLLTGGGFRVERREQAYATGPKPWTYFTVAVATRPDGHGPSDGR
jgi:SAM-dependent methyltransferase